MVEDSARTAFTAVASFLIARLLRMPEAYWATISTIIVMQCKKRAYPHGRGRPACHARPLDARILAVIGYSFGDEHVNQIIEQGLKKNSALRIVVVSPHASKVVRHHRFLDRNPRVSTIVATPKTALNERLLADKLSEVLKDVSTEASFP